MRNGEMGGRRFFVAPGVAQVVWQTCCVYYCCRNGDELKRFAVVVDWTSHGLPNATMYENIDGCGQNLKAIGLKHHFASTL